MKIAYLNTLHPTLKYQEKMEGWMLNKTGTKIGMLSCFTLVTNGIREYCQSYFEIFIFHLIIGKMDKMKEHVSQNW